MIFAAGILLLSKQGRALFLKRGPDGDNPGEWCFPGGRIDEGESAADAAVRETLEETGTFKADPAKLQQWTRRIAQRETTGALPTPAPTEPKPPLEVLEALAKPAPAPITVLPGEEVDFTTFILRDVEEFVPDVLKSGEHTAYAWASPADAPMPLHPGCRIALTRFSMNELQVAEAMSVGDLTSPQRYGNFMLFNIRITGTGVAYRHQKLGDKVAKKDAKKKRADSVTGREILQDEEYVYRNPADYLTDEFLQRCNGLLVVLHHPDTKAMDSKEFNKRTIGTVFKPFIRGDEVWGVAKIYDEDAIEAMMENQLSTSPGVVWRDASSNITTEIDGHNFLLEGKPSLMDHIAVCYQGVWDKGGPPAGIDTTEARKDAINMDKDELLKLLGTHKEETDTAIKTVLGAVESLTGSVKIITTRFDADDEKAAKDRKDSAKGRMDNFKFSKKDAAEDDDKYKEKHDAEEKALYDAMCESGMDAAEAEKTAKDARKDAEEEESKEAKKDADEKEAKEREAHDSALGVENKKLRADLDALTAKLDKRVPEVLPRDQDSAAFGAIQTRYDEAFTGLGMKTPIPMHGESLLNYRKRAVIDLKKHSKTFKSAEINVAAADEALFTPIENIVIKEALEIARSDATVPPGTLREVDTLLPSGHRQKTFFGNPGDWMADFAPSLRFANIKQYNANGVRPQ